MTGVVIGGFTRAAERICEILHMDPCNLLQVPEFMTVQGGK